ncbi:hypothetical protein BH11PLA2_BH11PLA2_13720 [soil metagenome]
MRSAMTVSIIVSFLAFFSGPLRAGDPKALDGEWLFDSLARHKTSELGMVWHSKLTLDAGTFSISKPFDLKKPLKGQFALDAANIDLSLDEFDLSDAGIPMKIPAGKLKGIWKLDKELLSICVAVDPKAERPTKFEAIAGKTTLLSLRKAPAGFKEFPKEIAIAVTGPDEKPALSATVTQFLYSAEEKKIKDSKTTWNAGTAVNAQGIVNLKYDEMETPVLIARDAAAGLIAIESISPARLASGKVTLALKREHQAKGTITCDELIKAGKELGWTNVYLSRDGRRVASFSSFRGAFEFPLPAGKYSLHAYGNDLGGRHVDIDVPEDRSEITVSPIALTAAKLQLMQGKTAPEFESVVGWSGSAIKLADLKGKYVLIDFWGYWCGPCIQAMPVLIELHEKFSDKGLVIVGVHLDAEGEVDTAAKLNERIAGFKKDLWNGKDLPFPTALTSGKTGTEEAGMRGGTATQYGILSFPTTILVDREGKIVGDFHARERKSAIEQIEKLLKAK